ncbi:MAG TPA: M20/M25/M40 family metallo-hydrolase, partial [Clostridia bacterium]|nr:M20/M25/M40 family metallo-hydrolase [Clostridia bacterium]
DLGQVTASLCVSIMEAGTGYNNVPYQALIWMDRRTVPGEDKALVMEEIEAVLDQARRLDPGLKAHLEVARPDWSWPPIIERGLNPTLTAADSPLFALLEEAAAKSGLDKLDKAFASCYYDMDFLVNDLGIPSLVYGPGDGRLNHSAAESVSLDHVCQAADIFCHLAEVLCL